MSTIASRQKTEPDMGKAVKIKQLLKDRESAVERYQTRSWMDEPVSTSCVVMRSDDDRDIPVLVTVVTMKSGKVWKSLDGGPWQQVSYYPLPDTTSDEMMAEIRDIDRQLAKLGYTEED